MELRDVLKKDDRSGIEKLLQDLKSEEEKEPKQKAS